MSDLIEKLTHAHWLKWSLRTTITNPDREAMRAALTLLTKPENISDEMVEAACLAEWGEWLSRNPRLADREKIRKAIAAAIRAGIDS